jgi:hypothetical protein
MSLGGLVATHQRGAKVSGYFREGASADKTRVSFWSAKMELEGVVPKEI